MVKVTLITNDPKEVDIVPETMTIREFLKKHNVNYGMTTTSIDGVPLAVGGMDKSFADYKVTNETTVASIANKDNGDGQQPQVFIAGSSAIIKSTLTPDEIKRVKKFHPEALVMDDEDGYPCYAVDIDEEQPGSINDNGACYGNATSTDGKATITILLEPTAEDTVQLVYDKIGRSLVCLKEIENHIREVLPELDTEEREIRSMITRI